MRTIAFSTVYNTDRAEAITRTNTVVQSNNATPSQGTCVAALTEDLLPGNEPRLRQKRRSLDS